MINLNARDESPSMFDKQDVNNLRQLLAKAFTKNVTKTEVDPKVSFVGE